MTFASDIPVDYQERKEHQTLKYGERAGAVRCAATDWGKPEHVRATLAAQNSAVRALAGERPDVLFVDEREMMPEQDELFFDVCHLSNAGSRRFVGNFWSAVRSRGAVWKAAHADGI